MTYYDVAVIAHNTFGTFGTDVNGPANPWGTPWQAFIDTIRVMLLLALGWNIPIAIFATVRKIIPVWRGITLVAFCWVVGETEWDALGYGVGQGGRLWVAVVAFVTVTMTTWHMRW